MSFYVCHIGWCEMEGLDFRSMRFARDVQKQVERMITWGDADDGRNDNLRKNTSKKRRRADSGPFRTEEAGRDAYRSLRKALTLGFANR